MERAAVPDAIAPGVEALRLPPQLLNLEGRLCFFIEEQFQLHKLPVAGHEKKVTLCLHPLSEFGQSHQLVLFQLQHHLLAVLPLQLKRALGHHIVPDMKQRRHREVRPLQRVAVLRSGVVAVIPHIEPVPGQQVNLRLLTLLPLLFLQPLALPVDGLLPVTFLGLADDANLFEQERHHRLVLDISQQPGNLRDRCRPVSHRICMFEAQPGQPQDELPFFQSAELRHVLAVFVGVLLRPMLAQRDLPHCHRKTELDSLLAVTYDCIDPGSERFPLLGWIAVRQEANLMRHPFQDGKLSLRP